MVLVGMSVTDVDRRESLHAAAHERGATVAFLQMGDPSLSRELTRLADGGAQRITLVGVNLGPLAPAHSWLRRIAAHWWRERAGAVPVLDVATRLVTSLDDIDVARARIKAISGDEPGLTSAAWDDVSGHRRQVLICRGPRCTAQGGEDAMRALILATMEAELGDDHVLITHTGCQFPCNQAPVVSVQPDDVWYGEVDPAVARAIALEHLAGGTPLESHRLPRQASM